MRLPRRGWWRRLRHSRGFGIHSPSAYRFIREVLCQRLAYYAYPEVDALAAGWPGGRSAARVLFRIAACSRAARVYVGATPQADVAAAIVGLAAPRARLVRELSHDVSLLVFLSGDSSVDAAVKAALRGATIVIPDRTCPFGAELLRRLRADVRFGHIFVNGSGAAVFVGRDVPPEMFAVRF